MAENAAHITSSLQAKPSIFEVIAQDSLYELLYPSFKIIVQFLGSNNPDRYHWLNVWGEEVFLGLNGVLQLYYLNNKEASFSESFYGLKRVSLKGENGNLTPKAKYWSLFCLVGLPYLALKAERWVTLVENVKGGELVGLSHRSIIASWRALCLLQYLRYLTGRSEAHSPLLSAANLSLNYSPEQPDFPYSWTECFSSPKLFGKLVQHSTTNVLELAAFFLQALQWWHSDEHSHEKVSSLVPPPPPMAPGFDRSTASVCPVCKEPCKIETALLTSGYVFCYRCIRDAITSKQQCPVTGLPTTLDELVRLYPTK